MHGELLMFTVDSAGIRVKRWPLIAQTTKIEGVSTSTHVHEPPTGYVPHTYLDHCEMRPAAFLELADCLQE